jgi:uncharacterized repeat protein (TIGR03803 family)
MKVTRFVWAFITLLAFATCNGSAQTFTVLHTFTNNPDGSNPSGLITIGNRLFGSASSGGSNNQGIVFSVNSDGTEFAALHSFSGTDGASPYGDLAVSSNTLFGVTENGGAQGAGAVYSVRADGTAFQIVHSFTNLDGARPHGNLVIAGGTLYGTTRMGGQGYGGVFGVNTDGSGFTVLHNFTAPNLGTTPHTNADGAIPLTGLVVLGDTLYGSTAAGGLYGSGGIFSVKTNGADFAVIHHFSADSDGESPTAPLFTSGNRLFGSAQLGGTNGNGTLFSMGLDGSDFAILHTFAATSYNSSTFTDTNTDGIWPDSLALVGGKLYGVAQHGGDFSYGTVFVVNTNGSNFRTLYSFTNGSDGAVPIGGIVVSQGIIFGTAVWGGSFVNGTVFTLSLQPTIQCTWQSNGAIFFTFSSVAGQTYQGQYATDFPATNWSNLGNQIFATNSISSVSDAIRSDKQRFYRVMLLP